MTTTDVRVPPDLWGEDLEGALSLWLVENGDVVSTGDVLCEVMVEKVTLEVVSPAAGKITLLVQPDTPVSKGSVIARISVSS
jgi:pyruvate/2-oxoglutarate dehydrogenase complex dihydrolipoamide acyltransferase (E2) component